MIVAEFGTTIVPDGENGVGCVLGRTDLGVKLDAGRGAGERGTGTIIVANGERGIECVLGRTYCTDLGAKLDADIVPPMGYPYP
jgi:hypothetical protein